ncbi:hypothetical protein MOQ72_28185 [Saccharopolyspora sp. K220]|nr:hypothetical protein [Saccharopolyspora soli]MCI2421327.1 hypothetical protein [Saccharopolyspora soli]
MEPVNACWLRRRCSTSATRTAWWSCWTPRRLPSSTRTSATGAVPARERRFTALFGRDGRVTAALGIDMVRPLRALRKLVADRTDWDTAVAA